MPIAERPRVKPHLFMPGQTVGAVIKLINLHDVSKEEMQRLIEQFKEINGTRNFKAGERVMIPVLPRHYEEAFKKK
jgi:hypothetical protein